MTRLTGLLFGLVACLVAMPAKADPKGLALRETHCDLDLTPAVRDRVSCYRLEVPRHYGKPERGTYELAVTVRRSDTPVPGQDPVLWLHGGPGAGTTAGMVNTAHPFFPGSSVVYIASRGAYPSEPQPCRDLDADKLRAFIGNATWRERVARYSEPFLACRRRLDALGISPDEFGTRLVTEDIERLRRALGVRRWNVWAVSYGTATAYDLLARYPRTVRAAYLDSPVAPSDVPDVNGRSYVAALERLGDHCREDAHCAARMGDLLAASMRARDAVTLRPLAIEPFAGALASEHLHLDREHYDLLLTSLMGSSSTFVDVPRFVQAVSNRDAAVVSAIARPVLSALGAANIFGRAAFHCVERPQYHVDQSIHPGGRITQMIDVCPQWSKPGHEIRLPRETPVPVLLITGEMDTITPPRHGVTAQAVMGTMARLVILPRHSHGAYATSPCARRLVHAFFERPAAPLDTRCLADEPRIEFRYAD